MSTSDAADASELFNACDLDGSGYIDKTELGRICTDLTPDELTNVFDSLDTDGDGKISVHEFNEGFREISGTLLDISRTKRRERICSVSSMDITQTGVQDEYLGTLDESLKSLSSQEHICELYQQLQTSNNPALIQQFESIIFGVIKDIQSYQKENESMVQSFHRERDIHEKHLRQLELEMELQVKNVESSIRNEVKKTESQQRELIRSNMEEEIVELKEKLESLKQLEMMFDKDRIDVAEYDKMRARADDMIDENRQLKSELTKAQTSLALVKSELAGLKQEFQNKLHELNVEKDSVNEYILEQDNLTRQLHLLHNANQCLQDKNDDLLAALETSRSHSLTYGEGNGGDYLNVSSSDARNHISSPGTPLSSEIMGINTPLLCIPPKRTIYPEEEFEVESLNEDLDSGMSTLRDYNEVDDVESVIKNLIDPRRERRRRRRRRQRHNSDTEMADEDSDDDLDLREARSDRTDYMMKVHSRSGSACSGRSLRSLERMDSTSSNSTIRRKLPIPPHKNVVISEPERMYKIVLAGDAAVGKSSFIMRLCKDKFVPNLSSTLGVDFQTKVIDVDGRTIALQLWDTAGQERFRSIAKSYFRRADGVLLLYDCTYERSFLNVRDWILAIEESSLKNISIMFCANKTDMRDAAKGEGKRIVTFEDGQRLAREYNGLFIETSAKDGHNITEAVVELGRTLRTNEDLEVKTVGMQLQELQLGEKKMSKCCG